MLAALLCNLEEQLQIAPNLIISFEGRSQRVSVRDAADRIRSLIEPAKAPQKKRIRRVVQKVTQALTAPEIDVQDFSAAQAQLSVLLFELNQSARFIQKALDPQAELARAQMFALLKAMQAAIEEEEAVIALLLTQ